MNEIDILKKENKKLKRVIEDKSNLISTTVHEVRTSLSALKWTLESLQNEGENNQKQRSILLVKIKESTEGLICLANDLLTINHTEESVSKYNFRKINVASIIKQIIEEFKEEARAKKVDIFFNPEEEIIPLIKADLYMIRIVFQNLIENSIKYSINGGKILINISKTKKFINISIEDQGVGIEKQDKNKIFKKFFRAENAKKSGVQGSGLGLFAVKQIILKHEGKINFENNKPVGTKFSIKLPIN